MPSIYGDWFHSRTTSHLSELATIQLLVKSSRRTEFVGKPWGADRNNPANKWIYLFSATAKIGDNSIQPSTMQTKIRNWIRLGFLKDDNRLPLRWTQLGLLWVDAVNNGRGNDANLLYQLILINSLALVSFSENSRTTDEVPIEEGLAVKYLLRRALENAGELSKEELDDIIDSKTIREVSKNYSYWTRDLVQSGLFEKKADGSLVLLRDFQFMIEGILSYNPKMDISVQSIRDNPLANGSPFQRELLLEFQKYGTEELLDAVQSLTEFKLDGKVKTRPTLTLYRDPEWPILVKENYNYKCAIPACDAQGRIFIEAAHVMPHRVEVNENDNLHRIDLSNGVGLCLSCHKLFDAGLYTISSEGKVVISKFMMSSDLVQDLNQTNIKRVVKSEKMKLKNPNKGKLKLTYISYHKKHIFLGE